MPVTPDRLDELRAQLLKDLEAHLANLHLTRGALQMIDLLLKEQPKPTVESPTLVPNGE